MPDKIIGMEQILNNLGRIWRETPPYRRPKYIIQAGFAFGLFWVEVVSGLVALLLSYTAFSDVPWGLDGTLTRVILLSVSGFHLAYMFARGRTGFWLRLCSTAYAAAWWLGTAWILWLVGAVSLSLMLFVLFALCFVNMIHLGLNQ